MKNYFRLLVIAAGIGAALAASAQIPAQTQADTDWLNLMSLVAPMPSSLIPQNLGQLDNAPEILQADQFENASQLAKAFYTAYPSDVFAPQARKLEPVMALQSVQLGDTQYKTQALAAATAYLADQRNSAHDRFDVALTLAPLSNGIRGRRLIDDPVAYEALAGKLHEHFGDIPEVYYFYAGIMRTVDASSAIPLAQELLKMNAPAAVQAEAQTTLDRAGLVGKPVDLVLPTADGKILDFTEPSSTPTIIYVWSNRSGTQDLTALSNFKSSIPEGTRLVYLSLQSDLSTASVATAQAPVPGIFCFVRPGFHGLAARTLEISQVPCVYVLSKEGILVGYGRLRDISTLLAEANQ